MKYLQEFLEENRGTSQLYDGDLESDFWRFLGQVQLAAKENPVGFEIDLRRPRYPK